MKRRFQLELTFRAPTMWEADDLEVVVECAADRLADSPELIDPDLCAELTYGTVTFVMALDARDPEAALHVARVVAHATLTGAAEECFPGREATFADAKQVVTPEVLATA